MTNFEENFWTPLVKAYNDGDYVEFDKKFSHLYEKYKYKLQNNILAKFRCDEQTAEDCSQEPFIALLTNISKNKDLIFKSENEISRYLYIIAKRYAIELIFRIPNDRYVNDKDDITYFPHYLNQPTGNTFRDLYDGKRDIDEFLKKEHDSLLLLELKIIQNLTYEEILALKEYSNYNSATLRKKVSRSLKKFKDFIKE